MLQELRTLAEKTKKDLSTAETKTLIVRYTGTAAKITVTRKQFEEMTAELLDETIRITARTLAEAEERHPGIRKQISQLLLVGGSSRMPAVSQRLKSEFDWEPRLTDPDLAVAKGAALYAAGQTVRYVETGADAGQEAAAGTSGGTPDAGLAAPGPVTDDAVRAVAAQSGLDEDRVRDLARRTVVNVLPKSIGIKLVDTTKPDWEKDIDAAFYIEHLVEAQTQLPFPGRTFVANTLTTHQEAIEIEIWEQAGASPSPDMTANHRVDEGGVIRGLAPFALPKGSPINIDIKVDGEGTVRLHAVEPKSTRDVDICVRISILSEEQVAEAKIAHAGLTVST